MTAAKKYREIEGKSFLEIDREVDREVRAKLEQRVHEWIKEQSSTTFREAIADGARLDYEIVEQTTRYVAKVHIYWTVVR